MNTGHDGSMGTVHANNPREAITRMENMIAMGGLNLPQAAVREQIASAVNVIIQVQRLRDGSRKVTHISEITGMEGEVVTMQELFKLEYLGEDEKGKLITGLNHPACARNLGQGAPVQRRKLVPTRWKSPWIGHDHHHCFLLLVLVVTGMIAFWFRFEE